jgi:hypothetical protein
MTTYWEQNAAAGRVLVRRTIERWLQPLDRQVVLDAGCGAGALARQLAGLGATVVGADLRPSPSWTAPRPRGLRFLVADLRRPACPPAAFTALVAQELIDDHPPEERVAVARALADWGARRMILVTRIASSWGEWADRLAGPGRQPPVDTVALFRGIHLETPYFLVRRETVRRRNHVVEVAEFSLSHGGAAV